MKQKVHDFHNGNRRLQDRFDTRRLAERAKTRVSETINDSDRSYIEAADMFFLATCDHRGLPTCSYKGGDPGFVRVIDESSVAFPNYDGNGKYQSMGNLLMNPNIGMLFIDFEGQTRLRLQGIASIIEDDELMSEYPGAQFIVRVQVTEVYPNCPRYIHKYTLVERSKYVPRTNQEAPIPEWKRQIEDKSILSKNDAAREAL